MTDRAIEQPDAIAILISGGLDSAILLGESLDRHPRVFPLYMRGGHAWEAVELDHLRRYLHALASSALQPLRVLDLPVADLMPDHWSMTGQHVPDARSPDEAVFLPGRNLLLLAKAMLWCHLNGVGHVALATLKGNPFPDATDSFFAEFEHIFNKAVGSCVRVRRPYAALSKPAVMERGHDLPLEWTFSCMAPVGGLHCGACNKCAERQRAFADAGMLDKTRYARARG